MEKLKWGVKDRITRKVVVADDLESALKIGVGQKKQVVKLNPTPPRGGSGVTGEDVSGYALELPELDPTPPPEES